MADPSPTFTDANYNRASEIVDNEAYNERFGTWMAMPLRREIACALDAAEKRGVSRAIAEVRSRLAPRALGKGITRGTLVKLATIYEAIDTIEKPRE